MAVNIWLLTGWRGAGKTTFCQKIVDLAFSKNWRPSGILSPAEFNGEVKEKIWAENIQSGEKRLLASNQQQNVTDLLFGDWFFNRDTLAWGNQVIQSTLPGDLFILDELGPLEFQLSLGWVSAFERLQQPDYSLAIVVVRPELVNAAVERWQPAKILTLKGRHQWEHQYARAIQALHKTITKNRPD